MRDDIGDILEYDVSFVSNSVDYVGCIDDGFLLWSGDGSLFGVGPGIADGSLLLSNKGVNVGNILWIMLVIYLNMMMTLSLVV